MVDLKLVHQLEIAVVRRLEDGVYGVPPDDLVNPLRDPLLDADCCEAEDVLPIGFVLRVAVVCDLWLNGAVFVASALIGRSRRFEHVSLLDMNGLLLFVERVADVSCKSLHSVGGVFI